MGRTNPRNHPIFIIQYFILTSTVFNAFSPAFLAAASPGGDLFPIPSRNDSSSSASSSTRHHHLHQHHHRRDHSSHLHHLLQAQGDQPPISPYSGGEGVSEESSSSVQTTTQFHVEPPQKCYVCLQGSEQSSRELSNLFPDLLNPKNISIPDCAYFTAANARLYEFTCPHRSSGCLLKIHGSQVSRTCSPFYLDDCKTANSVEYCYCTGQLCNADKTAIIQKRLALSSRVNFSSTSSGSQGGGGRKLWSTDETDDEDLLEENTSWRGNELGSGGGPDDPGEPSSTLKDSTVDHESQKSDHYPAIPASKNRIINTNSISSSSRLRESSGGLLVLIFHLFLMKYYSGAS